jgi:hypothetical protein
MSQGKPKRPDANLRRLSRAVIQLAQAQAEADAEAAHKARTKNAVKPSPQPGKRPPGEQP